MNEKQAKKVTHDTLKVLETKGQIKKLSNNQFSLFLGENEHGCPSLKDSKCTIYKSSLRPKPCHDFPIFIGSTTVFFSSRCLAVKNNMFYAYEKKFLKLGMDVKKTQAYLEGYIDER